MPEVIYAECQNCYSTIPQEDLCEFEDKFVCNDCYEELEQERQDEEFRADITKLLTKLHNDIVYGKTDEYHMSLINSYMDKNNLDKKDLV